MRFSLWVTVVAGAVSFSARAATVTVDIHVERQTITGIGSNYAGNWGDELVGPSMPYFDNIGVYNSDHLDLAHVRVPISMIGWEPKNDDNDPTHINWSGFVETSGTKNLLLMIKDLEQRKIPVIGTISQFPDWLVSNPGNVDRRKLKDYAEGVEHVAAFLLYAKEHYGVTIPYLGVNEPNGGCCMLRFSPAELGKFIELAGSRFAALGLDVKFILDIWDVIALVDYEPLYDDPRVKPYLGPVVYHYYGVQHAAFPDRFLAAAYDFAKNHGLPIWVTELGSNANCGDDVKTGWLEADRLALSYYRVLGPGGASVVDAYTYTGSVTCMKTLDPKTLAPYPAWFVLKQLTSQFVPGTVIVASKSDDETLLPLAGKNLRQNRFILQVINNGSTAQDVALSGLPKTTLTLQRSSATENLQTVGKFSTVAGQLTVRLPAFSVSTFSGPLNGS